MSVAALPVHVALVDETHSIDPNELAHVAGALNQQVVGEFHQIWRSLATVGVYATLPASTWAVRIRRNLDEPGALGYHSNLPNGQPVSYVMKTPDWTTTVSHEVCEMLADPNGMRMHNARLPWGMEGDFRQFGLKTQHSHVNYLLEVADPCEATSYGDVPVSDFITPAWYKANPSVGDRYSYAGGCSHPREVADGGYASFAVGEEWFQVFNEGGSMQIRDLGRFSRADFSSLREFTDHHAREFRSRQR